MTFFDYFQIAIIAIVLLFIAGKICYLVFVRKINPIAVARTGRMGSRVIEALAFFGLIAWFIEVVAIALHARRGLLPEFTRLQLFDAPAAQIIGVVLVSGGLIIFALAFFNFGDSWRMGIDRKGPGQLVTTGIFGITRNPIYVFFILWFIGVFLINGTVTFLVFAVLTVAVLHWQILREEKFLVEHYGEPYELYRKNVPRYLIW